MDLKDKKVLITGGSGGIGSVLAGKLQTEGAEVSAPTREEMDLTDRNSVNKFIKNSQRPDILINCAGIGIYKNLNDLTDEDWDKSLAVNLTAAFILTRDLLPKELVLNIGSGAGVIPMKGRSAYCSSKFALRGLTLSLAEEIEKPKICLVTLGSVLTDFGSLGLEKKRELQSQGRAYFTPEQITDKLIEIIKDDTRTTEYTFYPDEK